MLLAWSDITSSKATESESLPTAGLTPVYSPNDLVLKESGYEIKSSFWSTVPHILNTNELTSTRLAFSNVLATVQVQLLVIGVIDD